jgi:ribosomal protein S18 acetylase RimI-like enzyme
MSEVNIRMCREKDLPEVIALMTELQETTSSEEEFDPEIVSKVFSEMDRYPEMYLNLVAELSGKVVGFISVIFYKTVFHKGGTALINELVVTNSQRGRGIGQYLVERAKEEAMSRRMDEIEVGTERTNKAAYDFYRKNGFDQEYVLLGIEFDQ